VSQSPDLNQLAFTLNGDLSELAHMMTEVERFCAAQGLTGDPQFQLTLALDELFTNSVRHGGCKGVAAAVEIRLETGEGAVRVEFRDRGTPFDPLTVPPPDLKAPLEERARGGLGVHFVRQMMSNLQYDRCGDWNRLTMELPI
jgi:anti-sigma regulatory factor (Ser/Thr protein kinase)